MPEQRGNEKKSIFKKWWFWVLIVLIILILASLGGGGKNQTQEPTPQEETTSPNESVQQDTEETAQETPEEVAKQGQEVKETPDAAENAADEEPEKIEFSNILVNTDLGMTMVYGEVKNNDTKAHSFTVKVTFYDDAGKIIGTASGAVNDLNGGETKLFSAIGTDDISSATSQKVQVDTTVSTKDNTPLVITFSEPLVRSDGGITMIDVDTTNNDTSTHSFTVLIGFYDESNTLIGAATGAMNDLGAGETKTLSAMANGDLSNAASTKIYVDAMVR